MVIFLRRTWNRYSKLGKKRKKKRVWRKPKGRDNKMREKRRGYPAVVSIGYKRSRKEPVTIIKNIKELENFKGKEIILGKMGKKKKMQLAREAKNKGIKIVNFNIQKVLEGLNEPK